MKVQSPLLNQVIDVFAELPGIGKKSALRIALHLLNQPDDSVNRFCNSILKMNQGICRCKKCFNLSDMEVCPICTDPARDHNLICVVENIQDVMAIEETGQFNGLYHILGGVISPIEGIGPEMLHIQELIDRVKHNPSVEIVLAISPTIDGETTTYYISKKLEVFQIKISEIARGVAFGGELQYTDEITLGRSILARIPYAINGK